MSLYNSSGLQKMDRNPVVGFDRRSRRKRWNRKRRGVGLKDVGRHRADKYLRQGGVVGVKTTTNSNPNKPFVNSINQVSCRINSSDTTRGFSSVASRYIVPGHGDKEGGFVHNTRRLHGRYRGNNHPRHSSTVRVPPLHVVNGSAYPTQPLHSYSAVSGCLGKSMPGGSVYPGPGSGYFATSPTDHRYPSGDPSMYKRGSEDSEDTYLSYGKPGGSHSWESQSHQPFCTRRSQSIGEPEMENLRRAYKRAIALKALRLEFGKAMREWNHDRKQRCEYEVFVGEVAYDPEHPCYDNNLNSKVYDPATSPAI